MADNTADTIVTTTEKYLVPLGLILLVTTATMVFWPAGAALFQLTRLPAWITAYAGAICFASILVLLLVLLRVMWRAVTQRRAEAAYRAMIVKSLRNLSRAEQAVLREFVLFDGDVQELPLQDPAVLALRNKRILFPATRSALVQGRNMEFPFQLPSRVKELLEPDRLNLREVESLYDTNRSQFEAQRPPFRQSNRWY